MSLFFTGTYEYKYIINQEWLHNPNAETLSNESGTLNNVLKVIEFLDKRRLNLLKAIKGKHWGANPKTILFTYKVFIRPVLEYGSILFAHSDDNLLRKSEQLKLWLSKLPIGSPHGPQTTGAMTW